ncbi:MAG: hypothetical protein HZB26_17930 [Candidatus Hydrogenedentes bacterium]|nr:hypothetical protein [Candidatus Hydrogenedentota bacterium]
MGTIMVAGAIVVAAFFGQGKQGVVSSSDLDSPGASAPRQKAEATPEPSAPVPTKERRSQQKAEVQTPAAAPSPAVPPSQHEPPAAVPGNTVQPPAPNVQPPAAAPPPVTSAGATAKRGKGIAAFWMTAPAE